MHVNKLNNKVYIGQTKRDVSQRFRKCGKEYLAKNKRGKYYQPKFANALIKYGWDNFEHVILEDNIKTQEEANTAEINYIKKYNSILNGYNITKGGSGKSVFTELSVLEIDINKNILNEFYCSAEVIRCYNWSRYLASSVIKCCKNKLSSVKGKYFCFKKDYDNYKIKQTRNNKVVYQLDSKFNIINRFNNITEASNYINNICLNIGKNCTIAKIRECCIGRRHTTRGYYWCYEVDYADRLKTFIPAREPREAKKVAQYTLDNRLVKIYDSSQCVKKETNYSRGNVCSCCRGELKTAYGYIWKYVD